MEITDLLQYAMNSAASDFFATANKYPSFRRSGQVQVEGDEVLTAAQIDKFRKECISAKGEEEYKRRGSYDAAYTLATGERFRLNFLDSLSGPAFVARPVYPGEALFFEELGLPADALQEMCSTKSGIIIVVGSTGSGKSTTLAAMVNYINNHYRKHIITIEDPIEFLHNDINCLVTQRELNSSTTSFSDALRAAMRESPDVIVIGEMRDMDTVQVAVSAAMTGHLVITTVHTGDTVQAIERVVDLYPEELRDQIASDLGGALIGVIGQRLMPRADNQGMFPALEIMVGTPTVRKLVGERSYRALSEALNRGSNNGMQTFTRAIFRLFKEGYITHDTAMEMVSNKDELQLLLSGMESGADTFASRYGSSEDAEDPDIQVIDMSKLLRTAVKSGASDMLLSAGAPPMLRIHGELRPMDLPVLGGIDTQRLLSSILNPYQKVTFEEKREVDLALSISLVMNKETNAVENYRFRINGFHQRGTVAVVARVIVSKIPKPEDLHLPPQIMQLCTKQQGLILITGPTGSGKSTSLASMIDNINSTRPEHIITIEDPIEYVHYTKMALVEQREVGSDTLSFSNALKYALREDPDVILVGEMRDTETIGAALTAAETGHLVFGTLHTNSAPQTIDRIIDSFPSHQQNQIKLQLSSVLLGVISQRLLPTIDGNGRVAAFEIMVGTPPVQALIREGKTAMLVSQLETGAKDGMITMQKSLEILYEDGMISYEEMQSYLSDYKADDAY